MENQMTTLARSTAAALGGAALLLSTLAAPAQAEVYGIDDPADASASLTDIHALSVRHGADNVVVKVRFADLRRKGSAGMSVFLDSDRASAGPEYVLGMGLSDGTDYLLTPADGWRSAQQSVDCDYQAWLRYDRDVAKVWISRGCLDEPEEVRVSVKMTDDSDASHPITDWAPGKRRFTLPVAQG